jgi:hypothetical protein
MITMDEIHELERQCIEDDRRVRAQVRQYEQAQAGLNMRFSLAMLEYQIAMGECWAMALRPAFSRE